MKYIITILLFIWTLPQTLLGYIMVLCLKAWYNEDDDVWVFESTFMSSVCLGEVILLKKLCNINTLAHERGHQKQSRYLGWLYLIIVGLPSITLNLLSRVNKKVHKNYYTYFPENWADKLGKVNR